MKKKQLRKENEELRARVAQLEREKLALEIKLYAIGCKPNPLQPPWEITCEPYVSDGTNPHRPMYEIDWSPENSKPTTTMSLSCSWGRN